MFRAFVKIFRKPKYLLIAIITFIIVMLVALLFPNVRLLFELARSSQASFGEIFSLAVNLTGSLKTNFTILSAVNTTLTALLFGINISIISYYISDRKRQIEKSGVATGTLGLISGILGIGCASCGSLLISLLGLGGALAFLPFGGQEFGFIGIILLLLSIYLLLRKICGPKTCDTDYTNITK